MPIPLYVMRICMVAFTDLNFDYRIYREATSLRRAGYQVVIVASSFNSAPLKGWDNFEVHPIPLDRSLSLRRLYPLFWRRAYPLLVEIHPDAYHAHDLDSLWPAVRAARRLDRPIVYDSHEFWTEQSSLVSRPLMRSCWSLLEKRLIRQVDRVITVSGSIAQSLKERYGLDEVVVLHNLPLFRHKVQSNLIRETLDLPDDRPIVLYQGGFLTENGLREQIEAAAGLAAALVLIGDGPSEQALRNQVRAARLDDQVFFIPRVPFHQLHNYTCSADLGLCLIKGTGKSFYYSLPNKLFEYMMAGLPVLASNFPEMQRIVRETRTGATVDPTNIVAIREQIATFLDNAEQREACAKASLQAARQYNWEREAAQLTQLYATLA